MGRRGKDGRLVARSTASTSTLTEDTLNEAALARQNDMLTNSHIVHETFAKTHLAVRRLHDDCKEANATHHKKAEQEFNSVLDQMQATADGVKDRMAQAQSNSAVSKDVIWYEVVEISKLMWDHEQQLQELYYQMDDRNESSDRLTGTFMLQMEMMHETMQTAAEDMVQLIRRCSEAMNPMFSLQAAVMKLKQDAQQLSSTVDGLGDRVGGLPNLLTSVLDQQKRVDEVQL
jgi:hypothetical protein